jgi:hypothetical protein
MCFAILNTEIVLFQNFPIQFIHFAIKIWHWNGCYFKYHQVCIQATDTLVYMINEKKGSVSEEILDDLIQDLHTLCKMQWKHTGAFFLTLRCQAVSISLES